MKIERLMALWHQAQDLNFGEMQEVARAAEKAATDKVDEIRKAKFKALGNTNGAAPQSLTKFRTHVNASRFAGKEVTCADKIGRVHVYDCRVKKGKLQVSTRPSGGGWRTVKVEDISIS